MRLPRYHSLNLIKNADGYARFITKVPKPIGKDNLTPKEMAVAHVESCEAQPCL